MKTYRTILLVLVVLLSGFAFIPVLAFPLKVDVSWQRFAEAYNPAPLSINYTYGAPGSYFTVWGSSFQPNSQLTLQVNGTNLGTVTVNPSGWMGLILQTSGGDNPGAYHVTLIGPDGPRTVTFTLMNNTPVRAQEGQGFPLFQVPDGIGALNRVYLPNMRR